MITAYSSRELRELGSSMGGYLGELLQGAERYDRIAGYFSFSILDVLGEALSRVPQVRILCNAELSGIDVAMALEEHDNIRLDTALQSEWNHTAVPLLMDKNPVFRARARQAVEALQSGRLELRVLSSEKFGLLHAKFGILRYPDRKPLAFNGSLNETKSAAQFNYEAIWCTQEPDTIQWCQDEFETLWAQGLPLSQAVIEHIQVTADRLYLPTVDDWRDKVLHPKAAKDGAVVAPFTEMPLMQGSGLWPHQLYFIDRAFSYHTFDDRESCDTRKTAARLILADQVGLGKTIQLIGFAILAALYSKQPVLILVPASLRLQWMNEIRTLFAVPAAMWDGKRWVLEDGKLAPDSYTLARWPRMIGIVSTGLLTPDNENAKQLLQKHYSLVVVDEAHKTGADYEKEEVGARTLAYQWLENLMGSRHRGKPVVKSLVLATATPMQLKANDPWVFLTLLGQGDYGQHVLGSDGSLWRNASKADDLRKGVLHLDGHDQWQWIRNPGIHPVAEETMRSYELKAFLSRVPDLWRTPPGSHPVSLDQGEQYALDECFEDFRQLHNPFIEHTIFRTRKFLEHKLPKIKVELQGEETPIALDAPLQELKRRIDVFCAAYKTSGVGNDEFMSSFIHRRWTSSLEALRSSVDNLIDRRGSHQRRLADNDDPDELQKVPLSLLALEALQDVQRFLREHPELQDLKQLKILSILAEDGWDQDRVLLFSESYVTARTTGKALSLAYPDKTIGLYSAEKKTLLLRAGVERTIGREQLRDDAKQGKVDFLVATKAGQEGLNLQSFGQLINIDIPWNPAHLEQRKGRIQRLGQSRQTIHVYNLWYADTVEDKVYNRVRDRLRTFMDLYGVVPETINEDNFNEQEVKEALANPFKKKYEVEDAVSLRGSGLFALSLAQVCEVLGREAS